MVRQLVLMQWELTYIIGGLSQIGESWDRHVDVVVSA